jgi:polyisoprenoid-binding protein YceI
MTTIGDTDGEVRVFTSKDGLLSAVAHDLELAVTRFSITWDEARTSVTATSDPASLKVLHAIVHGRPSPGTLSPKDLAKIESNVASDVLQSRSEIRFVSSSVEPAGDGFTLRGTLTLNGRTNDLRAEVRRDGDRWVSEVAIDQPRWGIRPYSAMMGTLKIKPEIRVRVSVPAK